MRTQNTPTGAGNTTAAHNFLGLSIPQHTPGPWSLGASYDSNPHGDFEVFGAEFGFYCTGRVAVVDRHAGSGDFVESFSPQTRRLTAEANARLIAAAPELFNIVSTLLVHAESVSEIYGNDAPLTGGIVELALRAQGLVNKINANA
jgi:hypothetical protein